MKTVKGSWSRVKDADKYRKEHSRIFRRELSPEELQEEADYQRELRRDYVVDKLKDND